MSISRITKPILGMFVLIWMHPHGDSKYVVMQFKNFDIFEHFVKLLTCRLQTRAGLDVSTGPPLVTLVSDGLILESTRPAGG